MAETKSHEAIDQLDTISEKSITIDDNTEMEHVENVKEHNDKI